MCICIVFDVPVKDSQQHLNVLRGLALQLQDIVYQENQKCWGKPLGSTNLWQENVETIKRIQRLVNQIEIQEVNCIAIIILLFLFKTITTTLYIIHTKNAKSFQLESHYNIIIYCNYKARISFIKLNVNPF